MAGKNLSPIASESVATGAIMPLVSLKKHYKISLVIFAVVAFLAVPLAWLKGKSYYSATAVVHVAPRVANILQDSKEQEIPSYQQYQQFLGQQTSTVSRYDIVVDALNKLGDKRFVWQLPDETERRAAERLQAALVVKPVNDSYLFTVTLESDKKEHLDVLVNNIVDSYLRESQSGQNLYATDERLGFLYQQRRKYLDVIAEKQKLLTEISQEISVTTFLDNAPNPYDQLLADIQQAFYKSKRARLEAEANLELFENPKSAKATSALEATVADMVYKDQGLYSLKANMYLRRSKLVEQISGLDPKHPWHEQIKNQLAVIEAEVVDATKQLSSDVKRMLLEERRSKVTLTTQIEKDLLAQINEQKQRAAWFAVRHNEGLVLKQEIKGFYEQLQSVENRIGFLELESKAPGFVRVETYAKPPDLPVKGGRKKIFVMVAVLGAIISLVVPILIDLLDRRIRTAGQVEKLLGYKPLAALLDSRQVNISAAMIADQKRRLLLALNRERLSVGKPSQLVAVTAVNQGSSTTSLVFDLANDCQNLGLRSIVVETNTFNPDPRYQAGQQMALSDVMAGMTGIMDALIAPADGIFPDRIALNCSGGGVLRGYHHLQSALDALAETYHFIFLDNAPILLSADAEFFASISDVTLLLIAAQQTQPGEITRAVKLLERVDPKAVSFIVTQLQIFRGGGYYSKAYGNSSLTALNITKTKTVGDKTIMQPTLLLYLLHSGNLYGTERMALATLGGLRGSMQPVLFAPLGPVHQAAEEQGIETHIFSGGMDLVKQLPAILQGRQQVAICATGVSHSLVFLFLNLRYRISNVHLHFVHGGTDERLSYGRKKLLNFLPVTLVAVSGFVREKLLAHGVRSQQIQVLENFLPDEQINAAPQRATFTRPGVLKVLVVSRVDPIKRIDLLLDALDIQPRLESLQFRILGTGWDLETLRERAGKTHPNVTFVGFSDHVDSELANSDLLLHLCPEEPFGLAILEAMAAKLPLLLPDQGGAASLIPRLGVDNPDCAGLHFQANNAEHLATQLLLLQSASADLLNQMVDNAHKHLWENYSGRVRLLDYKKQFAKVVA